MKFKKIFKSLFTGKSHLQRKKICQDYAAYRLSVDGNLVLCISDGAGGGLFSELGSKGNVNAVLNLFQQFSVEEFFKLGIKNRADLIINECMKLLEAEAVKYNIRNLDQLSATLVLAVLFEKKNKILVAHVGDGIVAARKRDGSFQLLSEAENINGASNRTHFTCEYNSQQYYREKVYDLSDYSSILLCSDGPYNDIQTSSKGIKTTLSSLMEEVEQGKISNNIEFNRRLQNAGDIKDDWSMLLVSLADGNIVEN